MESREVSEGVVLDYDWVAHAPRVLVCARSRKRTCALSSSFKFSPSDYRTAALKRTRLLRTVPLHDAAEVARAGVPTIMMFVQKPARHQPQQARRHARRAPRDGGHRFRQISRQSDELADETLTTRYHRMMTPCERLSICQKPR